MGWHPDTFLIDACIVLRLKGRDTTCMNDPLHACTDQACVWQCTRELARAGKIKQCADVWLDLSISCLRLISCMHAARFPPMHDRACGIDLDKGRRSKTNHDTPAPPRNIYTYACIFRSKRYIHYWKIGMHSKCVHVSLNSRRYIWHNHAYNF